MSANIIKEQIIARANNKRMSINALEREAQLKSSSIASIISGRSQNPNVFTIAAIAKILDCSVDDLLRPNAILEKSSTVHVVNNDNIDYIQTVLESNIREIAKCFASKKQTIDVDKLMQALKSACIFSMKKNITIADTEFVEWLLSQYE